jgi:hypothetical protein
MYPSQVKNPSKNRFRKPSKESFGFNPQHGIRVIELAAIETHQPGELLEWRPSYGHFPARLRVTRICDPAIL